MYVYIYIYMYTYMYNVYIPLSLYIYIYICIHMCVYMIFRRSTPYDVCRCGHRSHMLQGYAAHHHANDDNNK